MDHNTTWHVVNLSSILTAVGVVAGWLPNIAALFALIWSCIQIWESKTVRAWMKRK